MVQSKPIEAFRNTFANLALPMFSMAEPVPPKAIEHEARFLHFLFLFFQSFFFSGAPALWKLRKGDLSRSVAVEATVGTSGGVGWWGTGPQVDAVGPLDSGQ